MELIYSNVQLKCKNKNTNNKIENKKHYTKIKYVYLFSTFKSTQLINFIKLVSRQICLCEGLVNLVVSSLCFSLLNISQFMNDFLSYVLKIVECIWNWFAGHFKENASECHRKLFANWICLSFFMLCFENWKMKSKIETKTNQTFIT